MCSCQFNARRSGMVMMISDCFNAKRVVYTTCVVNYVVDHPLNVTSRRCVNKHVNKYTWKVNVITWSGNQRCSLLRTTVLWRSVSHRIKLDNKFVPISLVYVCTYSHCKYDHHLVYIRWNINGLYFLLRLIITVKVYKAQCHFAYSVIQEGAELDGREYARVEINDGSNCVLSILHIRRVKI